MPPVFSTRTSLAVAIAIIFLAGLGAGAWRYGQTRHAILETLVVKASRCAVAFDLQELQQLSATKADLDNPLYAQLRERLTRLRQIEPAVRSVYIFRHRPGENTTVFVVGSEEPDFDETYLPGDAYREISASPILQASIATGTPHGEGPLTNSAGTWVTGYALIGSPAGDEPHDILGLDLSVTHWRRTLITSVLGTAGYVWLLLILPLVALVSNRRLAQQRDALRNLTEAMDQGHAAVVIVDLTLRIEYANTGFCRQLGYVRRDLIGREWRELQAPGTEPENEAEADIMTIVRSGQAWTGEWMMRRADDILLPVRGTITPVKDRHGTVRSFVAVFEDMTEIRRTEQVLREAKERAEAGDRAKGQFLATMSHEVRTPLNGIVGFASLLLDTELTPEQQEYVETIRTSSETLIQLTGDILDYARIESGRLKLEPQPCDPRECVENALDLVAAAAIQKNIELLHWVDEGVPNAIVADVSRLRQVVVNLVNNAVKFTSDGEVEIRLRLLRIEPTVIDRTSPSAPPMPIARCVLEFSIRDTGIGIAPEHHHKIFRPFSQVDESTTRRYGGTGLGLAICKNIVDLMHGSISFTSELGRGSTFTFTVRVPLHDPATAFSPPARPLEGKHLAICAAPRGLREELVRLGARLGAHTFESDLPLLAAREDWDLAIVDVTGPAAMELATLSAPRPGLPPDKMIALVPIILPGELRAALRTHARLVLNKPLHHDMLASLLGSPAPVITPALPEPPTARSAPENSSGPFDLRVLIVEDNAVNQKLIQKVVSKLGCKWKVANDGRAAVEELTRSVPDVVLMDLHMPELDGLNATLKIRAGEAGAAAKNVWIVALTADAREEQRARTLAAGANDYLTKPLQLADLAVALRRYVATRDGIG